MPRSVTFAILALAVAITIVTPAQLSVPPRPVQIPAAYDSEQTERASTVSRARLVTPTPERTPPSASPSQTPTSAPVAPPPAATPAPAAAPRPIVPTVADARAYALAQIGGAQFDCLDALFQRESGWNPGAMNPFSGAYGIPQALPGSKMAAFGGDWAYNPITQVRWGLGYISARYGSACGAWSFWLSHRWY